MKFTALPSLLLVASMLTGGSAAAQRTAGSSSKTTTGSGNLERTLNNFGTWVDAQVDRATETARRELPKISSEFERQSTRLDRAVDSLTVDGKREYAAQKTRYQRWATRQDSLDAAANRPPTAAQAQDRLLKENVNISQARAAELPELYFRLVETMRTEKRDWSQADWTNASAVFSRLNTRYEQVRTDLPLEERLRIRTLQGEFRTLEKARDVKDAIR